MRERGCERQRHDGSSGRDLAPTAATHSTDASQTRSALFVLCCVGGVPHSETHCRGPGRIILKLEL